jgi:hypothetical protein
MDLLSIIPFELREILFYSICKPEDLLSVYSSGILLDIFNNISTWKNKLINNFPLILPVSFPNLSNNIISRISQYKMMLEAFNTSFSTINDLDELFLTCEESYPTDDEQHLFLGNENNDNSDCNINNLDFLGLSDTVLEDINKTYINGYEIHNICLGKYGKDIRECLPNYYIRINMINYKNRPVIPKDVEFIEKIEFRGIVNLYFLTSFPKIDGYG